MKNITSLFYFILLAYSCAPPTQYRSPDPVSKSIVTSEYDYDFRWIDNSDIIELIKFSSENQKTLHTDVYAKLGEPIYIEKIYIDDNGGTPQNTILFWYKYKSKLYPVAEQETVKIKESVVTDLGSPPKMMESIKTSGYFQIKPTKSASNDIWENSDKWLAVVMFDEKYELILSDQLGTSSGLYMDYYNLSSAGYLEQNVPQAEELLTLIKKVVKESISD